VKRLVALGKPYKYIVTCTIMQKTGARTKNRTRLRGRRGRGRGNDLPSAAQGAEGSACHEVTVGVPGTHVRHAGAPGARGDGCRITRRLRAQRGRFMRRKS
jgi:hypothetical protein